MCMSPKFLVAGLFFFVLTACGGNSGSGHVSLSSLSISSSGATSIGTSNASVSPSEGPATSSALSYSSSPPAVTEKQKLLNNIADVLNKETCAQTKPHTCERIEIDFEASTRKAEDAQHPTVLIIDNHISSLAFAAYRNRVMDLLTTDESMNLVQYRPKVLMPTTVNTVFNLIKDYDGYLSVHDFSAFNKPANIQLFTLMNSGEGHGYYIAAFLLEHNPTAKFVFVESGLESKLYAPAEACAQLTSIETTESLVAINLVKSRYENYLNSLKNIIEHHNINFINASWGLSRPVLSAIIKNTCDAEATDDVLTQILAIDHQFIQALASHTYYNTPLNETKEVALVQAATYGKRKLIENDPDFPADCDSSIKNRIRVMDFMYAGVDIPSGGTTDTRFLNKQQLNSQECVDVFIPLGQTLESDPLTGLPGTRRQAMGTLLYGFFEFPFFPLISSPSLATPVVLSSLINEQSTRKNLSSPPELYDSFLKGNFIHDPILHNQFDVFTWQYRTPSW